MYGKLFDSMYDSTLAEDWRALITFQQMIILCDADGMLDMTPTALSRRTGIPIEHIEAGIKILERPDPYSRTPDQDGVRIELIDDHRPWGWHIVNHEKYKHLQDADTIRAQTRERVARHREKKKQECNVTVTDGNAQKRYTDIDTNINKTYTSKANASDRIPYQDIVDLYHAILPDNPAIAKLSPARKAQIKARWREDIPDIESWKRYFELVASTKFLTGRTTPTGDRKTPFKATIDFLIKEANVLKIVEGNYT